MAGVKGRSGGPRPNSGGARPGAGRKPKPKAPDAPMAPSGAPASDSPRANAADQAIAPADDPLAFLVAVMNNPMAAPALRVRAAIAAVQYTHTKRENGGKRDEQQGKAEKVAGGRFKAAAPPKLVVSNGR